MSRPLGYDHTDPIIRERELAARWRKSIRFLQRLRRSRQGPPWLRIGATVYYRVEDVRAFELSSREGAGEEE